MNFIQSKTGTQVAGTTVAATVTSTPTDGSLLVAFIATSGSTSGRVSSITQTGATWTKIASTEGVNGSGSTSEIWYAPNVASAGTLVTANLAATLGAYIGIVEVSGMVTSSSVVDVGTKNTGSGTETFAVSTGTTATGAQTDEFFFGGFCSTVGVGAFTSLSAAYTALTAGSLGVQAIAAYRVYSGTPTTGNISGSLSGPGNVANYAGSIVALKAAPNYPGYVFFF